MASAKTWKGILKIVALILGPLLKIVSPMIKDALTDVLQKLYLKAYATENPVDDLLVGLLLELLGIPYPEVPTA